MEKNLSSAEELKTIRKMMEESTKFLSISGLSGVFIGLYAIAGAVIAWFLILEGGNVHFDENLKSISGKEAVIISWQMLINALTVLVLSLSTALYFSYRNAKRSGKSFWTPASKRLLLNLFIPLITGGFFVLILVVRDNIQLIIPAMLIFYGLALINAGKFTYGEIFYLGICEISTGLASAFFPGQGLLFWVLGFGILHIVYGVMMYRKYEV